MFKKLFFSLLILFSYTLYGQYQKFAESYGILTTIAGRGASDNRGSVEWESAFEGGLAVDAELARPHFAMADAAGNIYIADKENHAISKVDLSGKITTVAGSYVQGDSEGANAKQCLLSNPNGLWVKNDGTLYILDLGNSKIKRANTDGSLETVVDDNAGISLGRGIWVSKNEDSIFYASSSKIKLWTASNGIEDYVSGFSGIGNIVQDMFGHLVVTARSENKVYRINKTDRSKSVIAGNGLSEGGGEGFLATETGIAGVRGVWFLEDNTYFLATHEGSQIWYVDFLGKIHLFLNGEDDDDSHNGDGERYDTPGVKISEARSVSVDYDGNVIICENDLGFIRKIENTYTYYYTSIKNYEFSDVEFSAFPNPAKNYVQITCSLTANEQAEICIYNSIGALLEKIDYNCMKGKTTFGIDVSDYTAGLYYYSLNIGDKKISKKLIIK